MTTIYDQRGASSRNLTRIFCLSLLLGFLLALSGRAAERFVSQAGAGEAPYTSWASAATNIQDAIDAAEEADVVWVTNGVYATGGKVMSGDLTNRVVLDKALTVRSVNGPMVTIIQGAGATNGSLAMRCAWLTNGATLSGFTLQGGATRLTGDQLTLTYGGGVWCASSNALVANCVVQSNTAVAGGGVYQGTLNNCAVIGNKSSGLAAGVYNGLLNHCTVVSNSGGGTSGGAMTNSIVYFNTSGPNYSGGTWAYCCAAPLPAGKGNISSEPQLLADNIHLASTSPCRGMGTNLASGTDIDGQVWAIPASMGCDQWQPELLIARQPQAQVCGAPAGLRFGVVIAGQEPFVCWWTRDGISLEDNGRYKFAHTPDLQVTGVGLQEAGNYQMIVSNSFGMLTSVVARVVVHCVDAASVGAAAPYSSWATAATAIQDAIEVAEPGEIVLVTNGLYAAGGKAMAGDLTNRVALDKVLLVQSVNGPGTTFIQGAWDPTRTAGPLAVRCAWLAEGAVLSGFTLQGGATRNQGDTTTLQTGGGVWCASAKALVANCVVRSNVAAAYGGGACYGTFKNCAINENRVIMATGGGVYQGILNSCTVVSNSGCGIAHGMVTNCLVYFNNGGNYFGGSFAYCCTTPLPAGPGNTSAAPQLLSDGLHLADTSPCRAAATSLVSGVDIDGQAWRNPPSIGCDEWLPVPFTVGQPGIQFSSNPVGFSLGVLVAGQEPFACWWTHDGAGIEEDGHYGSVHSTSLVVKGVGLLDAGSYQVVVSNAFGMATSAVAKVVVHCVNAAGAGPEAPYLTWETAATNIQDAINVAQAGDIVLVTNGLYATGGKAMAGDLTNRVALDKALLVHSINGPAFTTIQGACDPATVTGPLAVRCAWLTNGAVLRGFTLQNGATRTFGDSLVMASGGGVWCASSNALVANCVIQSNAAYYQGGGAYQGTLKNCAVVGNRAGNTGAGGVYNGFLCSCTVVSNWSYGVIQAALTNSIVYFNQLGNYGASTFSYCCTTPLPVGNGNIRTVPQLLADGFHLASTSPCREAGTNFIRGTDIDGQPWNDPPAIGCDEWCPAPVITSQPQLRISGHSLVLKTGEDMIAGAVPFAFIWLKDGAALAESEHYGAVSTPNLTLTNWGPADAGAYQLVASNAFGMATSVVAQLTIHCVDAASPGPVAPFTTWQTAAATIQEAIDVALPGELVLVTNGVYASGGKAVDSDLTNRVALTKPVMVMSVNGPAVTRILGAWDPVATNGPLAVRCAWLTNGATLSGFTLQGGATRATDSAELAQSGGGVWGASTNAVVMDCVICTNAANYAGGGCYQALLKRCRLVGNSSAFGGGANQATLFNCLVSGNTAGQAGGGTHSAALLNCTVAANSTGASTGGGVYGGTARNSIVFGNYRNWPYPFYPDEWGGFPGFDHVCTYPPRSSTDLTVSPQLLDEFHLAVTSPCRGAGSALSTMETDLDGEPWASPPSIGCDEVWEAAITGPLAVGVSALSSSIVVGNYVLLLGQVNGRATRVQWSFGDGSGVTNVSQMSALHTWTNFGAYRVTFTAYNVDNPGGVSTNLTVQILPLVPPTLSMGGFDGTNCSLSFSAQFGINYVVEQTTNLMPPVIWQTVTTVYGAGNPVQVTDTKATNTVRFYRVRKP